MEPKAKKGVAEAIAGPAKRTVTRVSRPIPNGLEIGDDIGNNLFDRSPDSRLIPTSFASGR
jgi:hypothetical protein